ncbi:D-alanyl-D-alanine carboxypeptidase [Faunimonas pinastri]|uniref:D-alanyl-D-alanine carboxypeptidase n=1 Tax=Faunimonas pinastri TaxID=1855383 RepID=A0A1H9NL64_9HYPH|nr:D-alanyl-D-alanine carboxypeptidase family protein [Faunimonas pinastri]SER36688.1 D-alanyl-D-alanine carboxypeptidase [Faunimonas pinastri]
MPFPAVSGWRRVSAAAVLFLSAVSGIGSAAAQDSFVGPYILADLVSGRIYAEHDANRPWYPASTTKLMTTLVVFEALQRHEVTRDSPVVMSANASAQPPSKMGFKPGTKLTLDNALKMMLVKSANDMAVAIAESVGGSEEQFVARMNEEAQRLGMTRTHFATPNGLPDPNNYTTARDMAVLTRAIALMYPQYRGYFSIPSIQFGKRTIHNVNLLVERYPGATGMKTGFICASGFNLIGTARRNGHEAMAVVFGASGGLARAEEAAGLLEEALNGSNALPLTSTTLQTVSSGMNYTTPVDMSEIICSGKKGTTPSETVLETADEVANNGQMPQSEAALPRFKLGPRGQFASIPVSIEGTTAAPATEATTPAISAKAPARSLQAQSIQGKALMESGDVAGLPVDVGKLGPTKKGRSVLNNTPKPTRGPVKTLANSGKSESRAAPGKKDAAARKPVAKPKAPVKPKPRHPAKAD